jgi:hypothetical protein
MYLTSNNEVLEARNTVTDKKYSFRYVLLIVVQIGGLKKYRNRNPIRIFRNTVWALCYRM